jgi:hypothetical protein
MYPPKTTPRDPGSHTILAEPPRRTSATLPGLRKTPRGQPQRPPRGAGGLGWRAGTAEGRTALAAFATTEIRAHPRPVGPPGLGWHQGGITGGPRLAQGRPPHGTNCPGHPGTPLERRGGAWGRCGGDLGVARGPHLRDAAAGVAGEIAQQRLSAAAGDTPGRNGRRRPPRPFPPPQTPQGSANCAVFTICRRCSPAGQLYGAESAAATSSSQSAAARGGRQRLAAPEPGSERARQLARPGVPAALGGTDGKPVWAGHMAGLPRRLRGTRR